jgi:hypothetical protein
VSGDRHLRPDPDGRLTGGPPQLATVLISADERYARTVAGQHLVQMLVNLLARQFGVVCRILLEVDEVPVHHGVFLQPRISSGGLRSALLALGEAVGGSITSTEPAGENTQPTAIILIGSEADPGESEIPTLAVAAHGWSAWARTNGPLPRVESTSPNPLGPHIAACLAAGFAFKSAYGKQRTVDVRLDLWGLNGEDGPELRGVRLPAAYVLGLGAVGAAFGFTLACAPGIDGLLVGVDPQSVADTDVNRLLSATNASGTPAKATLFKSLFEDSQVDVVTFRGKWPHDYLGATDRQIPAEVRAEESAGRYNWVISCVDRNRDRADIAARLPRHTLSGSTFGMAAQTSYFSLVGACECLGCRHRTPSQLGVDELAEQLRELDATARRTWYELHGASGAQRASIEEYLDAPKCSGPGEADLAKLGVQGEVDWAVGFVSGAAGVILAARFVRIAIRGVGAELQGGSEKRLLFWADELLRSRAQRLPDCPICGGTYAETWKGLWG